MAKFDSRDIDQLIINFKTSPSVDIYYTIDNWLQANKQSFMDQEYIICVQLFLLGAQIKYRFSPLSYEEHVEYIKKIRSIIEEANPLVKARRKMYLDFGIK